MPAGLLLYFKNPGHPGHWFIIIRSIYSCSKFNDISSDHFQN